MFSSHWEQPLSISVKFIRLALLGWHRRCLHPMTMVPCRSLFTKQSFSGTRDPIIFVRDFSFCTCYWLIEFRADAKGQGVSFLKLPFSPPYQKMASFEQFGILLNWFCCSANLQLRWHTMCRFCISRLAPVACLTPARVIQGIVSFYSALFLEFRTALRCSEPICWLITRILPLFLPLPSPFSLGRMLTGGWRIAGLQDEKRQIVSSG